MNPPHVITWIDSSLQNGQVDRSEFPKPAQIETIGYVVEETNEYVTLARDAMEGDFRGLICIPMCCVIEKRRCKVMGDAGWDH